MNCPYCGGKIFAPEIVERQYISEGFSKAIKCPYCGDTFNLPE